MKKNTLALAAVILVLVMSGCTSAPSKPAPDNPSGTLLDVGIATGMAKDYAYSVYEGSSVVVPFNITRKLWGGPAAWDSTESGNCSRWFMYIEGVMLNLGIYRYVRIAVEISIKEGVVTSKHANVEIKTISSSELNATARSIWDLSIERYNLYTSHDLFMGAQAAKYDMSSDYYLQSVSLTLFHNTTSPLPGTALWQVSWRYIDNNSGDEAFMKVDIDPSNGKIIKVEAPE